MHCLSCNYDLSHLTEHRCPECGREFDPSKPTTFFIAPNRKPAIVWLCVVLCGLALLILALFELQRMPYRPPEDMSTFLGGSEIRAVRTLMAMLGMAWVGCAAAVGWLIHDHRSQSRNNS